MELVCLIVFHYFSCSATSLTAFIQFLYSMLFILLSKYKFPRVLTHAIKTVFGMALPSRNRSLGKGRAAKGWKGEKKKMIYFIISERLWNKLGSYYRQKGQATPQDTLTTDQPSLPNRASILNLHKNEAWFLLDHSLFLWQTKGMLWKTQSPGWNKAIKDHTSYAQDGCRFLFPQHPEFNHATALCEHCSQCSKSFCHTWFMQISPSLQHHPPPSSYRRVCTTTEHTNCPRDQEGESEFMLQDSRL